MAILQLVVWFHEPVEFVSYAKSFSSIGNGSVDRVPLFNLALCLVLLLSLFCLERLLHSFQLRSLLFKVFGVSNLIAIAEQSDWLSHVQSNLFSGESQRLAEVSQPCWSGTELTS
jgi:hypothetical protein